MNKRDLEHYRERVVAEETAAKRAAHPHAASSHRKLAEEYASLILSGDTKEEQTTE